MKFIDVDPDELLESTAGHRGRVSYPLLKSFLETGKYVVKLDRTGMQQNAQGLRQSLQMYIRNHDMPIKIFSLRGELYLMRLDIDRDGNAIENWRAQEMSEEARMEPRPIDSVEVANRFAIEKDKAGK